VTLLKDEHHRAESRRQADYVEQQRLYRQYHASGEREQHAEHCQHDQCDGQRNSFKQSIFGIDVLRSESADMHRVWRWGSAYLIKQQVGCIAVGIDVRENRQVRAIRVGHRPFANPLPVDIACHSQLDSHDVRQL
jgi:hypothetical protein